MTEVSQRLYRALYRLLLVAGLLAAVFTVGCKKKPVPAPAPPAPAPAPAPAQPTVTLSADPSSINKGESSTLSWTSTNATQLTVAPEVGDRKSTRLNSSHLVISYAVFCLKKKTNKSLAPILLTRIHQ